MPSATIVRSREEFSTCRISTCSGSGLAFCLYEPSRKTKPDTQKFHAVFANLSSKLKLGKGTCPVEKIPNAKVWNLGREYLEAAEILGNEMKLWPAAVLAALSIEIFLKSFLAQEDKHGYPSTKRGHTLNRPGIELTPRSWTVTIPPIRRCFLIGMPPD
jgi:hypothetical protein